MDFVADLAARWLRLARTPAGERRVAIVLANYPNRDGRLGNGVGLDTPAGTVELLRAMRAAGYATGALPADGQALIERLAAGPTNALADRKDRAAGENGAMMGAPKGNPGRARLNRLSLPQAIKISRCLGKSHENLEDLCRGAVP